MSASLEASATSGDREKLDLRKQYKYLYSPSARKIEVVDVPRLSFARVDGAVPTGLGPGDSPDFQEAVAALYGLSYTLKFMIKKRPGNPIDYPVMWLEGLWMTESGSYSYNTTTREVMTYTAMILQPEFITPELFEEARAQLQRKKPGPGPARVRLEPFHEGLSLQVMHIGSYATEPETVARLRVFAAEHGYTTHGRHHEIYLSDPLKTAPERMRTILRHPVRRVSDEKGLVGSGTVGEGR